MPRSSGSEQWQAKNFARDAGAHQESPRYQKFEQGHTAQEAVQGQIESVAANYGQLNPSMRERMMRDINTAETGTAESAAAARLRLKAFGIPTAWSPEMITMIRMRLEDKSRDSRYAQFNNLFKN